MRTTTKIKSGALTHNHNETLRVKSRIKAGALTHNHNERLCVH